ncbi:MAG: hypothetical protein HYU68_13640 [Bacteroidetes bacterium]|nr:hypothetical protein [Bacteroidota bacterium]
MKKTIKLILIALTLFATEVNAQDNKGQAPAMQLANYVNPFTGDFSYSIPLVGVTGPNGESFPLNLNYAGGIGVNQMADWVGLGWNLNIGEIVRQENGVPDDFRNVNYTTSKYHQSSSPSIQYSYVFGPLYFDNATSTAAKMDLYGTSHNLGTNYFVFPDYDDYYVSGPGIGGQMRPFLFDFAEYAPYTDATLNSRAPRVFTKKPMFRFVNEPMARLTNTENFRNFINNTSPLARYIEPLATNTKGKIWKNRNGDNNVFDAGNYIEYFTNQQIIDHYANQNNKIEGFIDCSQATNRSTNPNGIGAFRVTTPSGMVYHYSLPVYSNDADVKEFVTNNFNYTSINMLTNHSKSSKYAYIWKLTAITDVTFEDVNEDNLIDEDDTGYWINIGYSKWDSEFNWRFPYYNFYPDVTARNTSTASYYEGELVYAPSGTVIEGNSEIYYPELIKTATQTMYFIKDVRADDHSVENTSNNKYTPKLLLKYILLFDNDDVTNHNIFSVRQSIGANAVSTKFEMPTSDVLNTEDYDYYQSEIETYALKVIDFDYDYHLSEKLSNNIFNTFTETTYSFTHYSGTEDVFVDGVFDNSTNLSMSGKLTLNAVTTYNLNHQQKQPPYLFEYNNENPDFKQEQQDIFGFYKDDFNSTIRDQYIITDSDKVDAWSLSKIITPLGGEITVEYESDTYNGVIYDSENVPHLPTRFINNLKQDDINFYSNKAISTSLFQIDGQTYTQMVLPEVYGGGIRVKKITLEVPQTNDLYELNYTYSDGLVTVEPDRYQRSANYTLIKNKSRGDRHAGAPAVGYSNVKITLGNETTNTGSIAYNYKNYSRPYYIGDNPNVGGASVEETTGGGSYDIQLLYNGSGWVEVPLDTPPIPDGLGGYVPSKIISKYMTIDYTLSLIDFHSNQTNFGQVNSVTMYDAKDVVVSKTLYEYSNPANTEDAVGNVQEVFYDYIDVRTDDTERKIFKNTYMRSTPVTHLKKETTIKDGLVTVVNYAERDNFTGLPTKITTTASGYAQNTLEKTYAYETNSTMGAKTSNINNLNILTPVQEEIESRGTGSKYEWSDNHLTREWNVGSQKYTLTPITSIWSSTEISTFNGLGAGAPLWKKLRSSTLYGGRNNTQRVERKDIKDGYSAVKFGYDNRFKIAEVSNCNYASFAYSSFESLNEVASGVYHFDGEVIKGSSNRVGVTGSIKPHTGDYMVEVPSNQFGASYKAIVENETIGSETFERGIQIGRTYVASVWVHKDSPDEAKLVFSLDGSDGSGNVSDYKSIRKDATDAIQIGDWIQLNLTFTIPANYVSLGGPLGLNDMRVYMWNNGSSSAYYDDFVIHPVDAQFTGYVYDERLGLVKAVISNDNFYTRFEHDNSGEVISTFKETQNGDKIVKSSDYNFKRN